MNILEWNNLDYGPSWIFIFITRLLPPPPRWALCPSSVSSYPNHLKNGDNVGHTRGLIHFPAELNLATISCPGRKPYTDHLLRGGANPTALPMVM